MSHGGKCDSRMSNIKVKKFDVNLKILKTLTVKLNSFKFNSDYVNRLYKI